MLNNRPDDSLDEPQNSLSEKIQNIEERLKNGLSISAEIKSIEQDIENLENIGVDTTSIKEKLLILKKIYYPEFINQKLTQLEKEIVKDGINKESRFTKKPLRVRERIFLIFGETQEAEQIEIDTAIFRQRITAIEATARDK